MQTSPDFALSHKVRRYLLFGYDVASVQFTEALNSRDIKQKNLSAYKAGHAGANLTYRRRGKTIMDR